MTRARGAAFALVLACTTAAVGCGLGPGSSEGTATLTVSRDYGSQELVDASAELQGSDTALRVLDRSAEVETRYGGRFVESIDGLGGGQAGGRLYDWFYYVNGIEAPRGAADFDLAEGDRVWWDYRDWTEAMRVPAVVGSWPEPFVNGFDGERWPVRVECEHAGAACSAVRRRLEGAGATVAGGGEPSGSPEATARVLVGAWSDIRDDPVAGLLDAGPARSGVFASFVLGAPEGWQLVVEDASGAAVRTLGPGSGLVAALRAGDGPPTWLVTGTDEEGSAAAASSLDADALRNRYAVAIEAGGEPEAVPAEAAR